MSAKNIVLSVISPALGNKFIREHHYSGKVVPNSQLHFGVYLDNRLHGVLQFGVSMRKDLIIGLVAGTKWNEFIELNRMALDQHLPKNSESRAIAIAIKLIKKNAPHVKWIISFADGTQCGDGTIYRASGFVLTGLKRNSGMRIDAQGNVHSRMTFTAHRPNEKTLWDSMKTLEGYQLRYIYFIDKSYQEKLTVPIIPFSKIKEVGATMYLGQKPVA